MFISNAVKNYGVATAAPRASNMVPRGAVQNALVSMQPRVSPQSATHIAQCSKNSDHFQDLSRIEEQPASVSSEVNLRSSPVDSAGLSKTLIPWNLAFDGFGLNKLGKSSTGPVLENDQVQPNWFESVQDPGLTGPYEVHDYFIDLKPTATGRTLNAQVMAPSQTQKTGPAPVVLISPPCFVGELGLPFNQRFFDIQPYIGFMEHFASMGYVAVGLFEHRGIIFEDQELVDHQRDAFELKSITDQLLGDDTPLKEAILQDEIAVMGHSKGGKMAFYHSAIDPRVKLILAIDPVNMGGPPWFVSKKFADNPVAPAPGVTKEGEPSLMDDVHAKAVIFRAPPDFVNFDGRFNAEHFWEAFDGDGLYIDCNANHGDWLLRQDLRQITRRVFTAALMDVFHDEKPFSDELRACEIKGKSPKLINAVAKKSAPEAR